MSTSQTDQPDVDEWRRAYDEHLARAVEALTAAGRLRRPTFRAVDVDQAEASAYRAVGTAQADWAEFVALALAGAAANLGGVETALAGRSGSWEAAGVRQLLHSTVGEDEAYLWGHRTKPLEVTVYVDEILTELGGTINRQYDEANDEITARWDAADAANQVDYTPHAWTYHRDTAGRWVSSDPAAPPFSRDTWLHQLLASPEEISAETVEILSSQLDDVNDPMMHNVYVFKSPENQAAIVGLEEARAAVLDPIGDLQEALEAQRLREWDAYGQALKATIEAAAGRLDGLSVPVVVTVDTLTYRSAHNQADRDSLEVRLVEAAVMDTPTPDDLPGTPLQRLEQRVADADNDGQDAR